MEEIEIASWLTLDAIKKKADIVESVGNLQAGHSLSVFCIIEDDYLELCYSDSTANTMRRYDDREEFDLALEERKEESGEVPFEDEEHDDDDDYEAEEEGFELEDDSENF